MLGTWTAAPGTQDYLSALLKTGPLVRRRCCSTARSRMPRQAWSGSNSNYGAECHHQLQRSIRLAAIVSATEMIREGHASALAAGGVDAVYEIFFKAYRPVSGDVTRHIADARLAPFDASRSGLCLARAVHAVARADGHGIAWRDGVREILGVGASSAAVALNVGRTRPPRCAHNASCA